jgi:hypothetical protein
MPDPSPDPGAVHAARREARAEAAPFTVAAAAVFLALALVSRHAGWELLDRRLWWLWLLAAVPYALLAGTLILGGQRLARHDRARAVVLSLLALVWLLSAAVVVLLVVALMSDPAARISGRELLFSGGAVWFTNVIAFGLAYWELDCGGPVARALVTTTRKPDFQFPQDENPHLARDGWVPRLWDYLYVSLTNSIAFSPTDAMPMTRPAKALMAAESTLSAVALLVVAARAVNILS